MAGTGRWGEGAYGSRKGEPWGSDFRAVVEDPVAG